MPLITPALTPAHYLTKLTLPPEDVAIDETNQPGHGSVVMLTSSTGTVYQRFFDGKYHAATGEVIDYEDLFFRSDGEEREVYLIYSVPSGMDKEAREALDQAQRAGR